MNDIRKYMEILTESELPVAEDHHTNKDMLKLVLLQVKNNISQLELLVDSVEEIEPWVLSKMSSSSENIESIFNYLNSHVTHGDKVGYQEVDHMHEAHPNSKIYDKCWDGYEKVPGKKRGEPGSCRKK